MYIVSSMVNQGPVKAHLRTNTGLVREHNEDYVAYREPTDADDAQLNGWLYLVADGVGGADAGEVASRFAAERFIANFLETADETNWGKRLLDAMQTANQDLRRLVAERNDNSRMATTMVTAVLQNNQVFIGNVGDSRGYHWRNGQIEQITKDQSLVAKLVEEGAITEAEAHSHPRRNVILYSLGSERQPQIDLFEMTLQAGDILLLCSDGLTRHVTDEEIGDVIEQEAPEQATETLIAMANQRGGEDNISVAIIHYQGQMETAVATPAQSKTTPVAGDGANRAFLWLYTGLLAIVLIFLILFSWLALRV